MDLFDDRRALAMLLTETDPFDSEDYIYELKLDGIRCLVYLDDGFTELRNKRNKILNSVYPELSHLHEQVNKKCILDGELIVVMDGKPDFFEVQRRSLMTDKFKIELSSKQKPVQFVVYDMLYLDDEELLDVPLIERKRILKEVVTENESIAVSRIVEDRGIGFYEQVAALELEGVVAKKKNSRYQMGKRSKYWIKFKKMMDEDFVICGYTLNEQGSIKHVTLGLYKDDLLIYQGHVAMGISRENQRLIMSSERQPCPFLDHCDEDTIWIKPHLVGIVEYMMRTSSGNLRQPVFKGLRFDKEPKVCILKG